MPLLNSISLFNIAVYKLKNILSYGVSIRRSRIDSWGLLFILGLVVLAGLVSCQKSFMIINHAEIRTGYISGDLRYVPFLKRVVQEDDRDLASHAMFQLGNIYQRLVIDKNHFTQDDEQFIEDTKLDLEGFFVSNLNTTSDFNLKNHIYRNLIFSLQAEVEDIYLAVVKDASVSKPVSQEGEDGKVENIILVLELAGKRLTYNPESEFDKIIEICKSGFDVDNNQVLKAGVTCFNDLAMSVLQSDFDEEKQQTMIDKINSETTILANQNSSGGLYQKYLATRLNGITNVK